ncbi:MAG: prepilin-type N-terminal cleavage/methylation domain-containing protein [Planctomycetes bacterium]|nr:prepilin-type N-terminal cleavage/methylation domain-containing protein [Planctomycetota bacterium]
MNRHRCGFSLVELVTSLAIISILMVAMGSAVVIAARGLPDPNSPFAKKLDAAQAAGQLADEVAYATTILKMSPTELQFIVDRNGTPITISYSWTGTPGDPLTRQYNGGAVINVLEDVYDFNLDYHTKTVITTETQSVIEQIDESLFANFEGWSGITPTYNDFAVGPTNWCAEFFNAAGLPANTSTVTITRCLLKLKQDQGGNITVGIHRSKGGGNPVPNATPIGTPVTVPVSTLPTSYQWVEFTFSDVLLKQLNKEFVIVVKGDIDNAAQVQYLSSTSAPKDDPVMFWTTDSGKAWAPKKNMQADNDMYFSVWGTYETTTTVTQDVTRNYLTSTGLTLQVGADTSTKTQTAVQVLNAPDVSGL